MKKLFKKIGAFIGRKYKKQSVNCTQNDNLRADIDPNQIDINEVNNAIRSKGGRL